MSRTQAASTARLRALLAPVLERGGLDLEDLSVTLAGRRRLVRVVVDRDGGLSLDDVAETSAAVSGVLDSADAMGETPYVLEVSSPGVDRPLREPRHWRRAAGRLVTVAVAGEGMLTARVDAADDRGVTLRVSGGAEAERRLPYAVLGPGAVQVEFGRAEPEAEELAGGDLRR